MAKTQLRNSTRDSLHEWMVQQHNANSLRELDKPRDRAIEVVNKVIRLKYPETDMVILRKYGCTRTDTCLRFVNNDTGQVFGITFGHEEEKNGRLADMPRTGGCNSRSDVFPVTGTAQKAIEAFERAKDDINLRNKKKSQEYRAFLSSCRFVEEVNEVVALPEEMKQRYMSGGGALVAISPDIISSIKSDFKKVAA